MDVVFDGEYIWVANFSGTVNKLLASTGELLGTYGAVPGLTDILFDGTNIWVVGAGGGKSNREGNSHYP
jgi:hypothetical protein